MRRLGFIVVLCLLAAACTESAPASVSVPIEGRWACFNGTEIIRQAGKYGLVDMNGTLILPSDYASIEFLDSDYALLDGDDNFYICGKNGRILAKSKQKDSLYYFWRNIVEDCLEQDRQSWEQVIQSYGELCDRCKSCRGHRLSRKDFDNLSALQKSIVCKLNEATGTPTASQRARLEALSADFRKAF